MRKMNETAGTRDSSCLLRLHPLDALRAGFFSGRSLGQKGQHECIVEVKYTLEILDGIRRRFPKYSELNEIPHHVAEIVRLLHSPILKYCRHHRPELLESVKPDSFAKLLTAHVSAFAELAFAHFHGLVQRITKEEVSLARVARIGFGDEIYSLCKIEFLHVERTDGKQPITMRQSSRDTLLDFASARPSGVLRAAGTGIAQLAAMKLKGIARIAVIIGLAVGGWFWNPWRSITHPPGVLVSEQPIQGAAPAVTLPDREGWKLKPVAEYRLRGRVLGTKRYRSGFGSELVPVDVAVGWGRMSDQAVLDQFKLSMSNRFFFYQWDEQPAIPEGEIMRSASNNHVIAANKEVSKAISSLIPGHIVTMSGFLVNAIGPDGGVWNSSTRRDDTGNGACEVFYVQAVSFVNSLSAEMDSEFASR